MVERRLLGLALCMIVFVCLLPSSLLASSLIVRSLCVLGIFWTGMACMWQILQIAQAVNLGKRQF